MNSRQMQCAVLLAQVRNFSQVAEQLHISQPALSKHIRNLEEELGVRLFDREMTPLGLTAAGEQFVRQAEDLLYKEDRLKKTMEQFRSGDQGKLVIGISPFRAQYLLSDAVAKLREKYPGVQICLQEAPSNQLRKDAAEGKYDFAVVNLPVDESLLEVSPMAAERLVLVVPASMAKTLSESGETLPVLDLAQCSELPFVVVGQSQEMRRAFERMCARAQIQPNIAMEVVGLSTAWSMVKAGIGAALLPLPFVRTALDCADVRLYTVAGNLSTRQPVIVKRRGYPVSEAAQYAMELLVSG